ncbi:hypothetical protein GJ496_006515 [Pomphorhynchus laevis]|nr:hypothetical protein GJ496_006515 [Pomphorhynchus laevis]
MSPVTASSSGGADGEPRGKSSTIRQRRTTGASQRSSTGASSRMGGGSGGMWRFYTEDSPGIKIGPLPVLVFSLSFIACVFILHIWGKLMRS